MCPAGLIDKRLTLASARRIPVDEALALLEKYRTRQAGWSVKHFYSRYRRDQGGGLYTTRSRDALTRS